MSKKAEQEQRRIEKETRLKALSRELADTDQILTDLRARRDTVSHSIRCLTHEIEQLRVRPGSLKVSDHAILRYAERHYSFPFEKVKSEIATILNGVESLGDVRFSGFIVKGSTVTTYVGSP